MAVCSAVREGAYMRTLFMAVSSADVASQRPNSVKAEAATVMGKTDTLRMRLRSSGPTIGRMAAKTAHRKARVSLRGEKRGGLGMLRFDVPALSSSSVSVLSLTRARSHVRTASPSVHLFK